MGEPSDIKAGDTRASGAAAVGEPRRGWFRRHWRGELRLVDAFWVNGILGTWAMHSLIGFFQGMNEVLHWSDHVAWRIVVGIPFIAGMPAFMTWQCVGIWRSAPRYQGPRIWAIVARLMVGVFVLWMSSPLIYILYASLRDGLS